MTIWKIGKKKKRKVKSLLINYPKDPQCLMMRIKFSKNFKSQPYNTKNNGQVMLRDNLR